MKLFFGFSVGKFSDNKNKVKIYLVFNRLTKKLLNNYNNFHLNLHPPYFSPMNV